MRFDPLTIIAPNDRGGINVEKTYSTTTLAVTKKTKKGYGLPRCEDEKAYSIQISSHLLRQLTNDANQQKYLYNALLLHELSHIAEGSFILEEAKEKQRNTELLRFIYNILEDKRVEYMTQIKYPQTTNYFNLLNYNITKQKPAVKPANELERLLNGMLRFIIFDDLMEQEESLEFISFLLPIEALLKKTDANGSLALARLIYDYLHYKTDKCGNNQDSFNNYKESLEQTTHKLESKIDESIIQNIEEAEQEDKGGEALSLSAKQKQMFDRMGEIRETIIDMTSTFRLMFESKNIANVKDGEIDFNRQQEIYLDSFLHEEGYNYLETKTTYNVDFDFVLLKDISSSIMKHKDCYYNATLSMLSSLEKFDNVRTACIEFNEFAYITKGFEDRLAKSNIGYKVRGGTDMLEAINLMRNLKFKNENKFVMVVTDGDTSNKEQCINLKRQMRDKDIVFVVLHVEEGGKNSPYLKFDLVDEVTTFDKLNLTLYKILYDYIKNLKSKKKVLYG